MATAIVSAMSLMATFSMLGLNFASISFYRLEDVPYIEQERDPLNPLSHQE